MATMEEAVVRYLKALDERRRVGPGKWLNLKGAARQAKEEKLVNELYEAEAALRALAIPAGYERAS